MIVCISPTKVSHKNKISVKSGNPSVAASIKKSPFYTMAKSILKETMAKSILKETVNLEIRKVNIRILVVLYDS